MDSSTTNEYLDRIGATRPSRPDDTALRSLHLAHQRTVPFENLSIHLGEDLVLEEKTLLAKVVTLRRGGFCYELNGSFAALLRSLGYDVTRLAARTLGERGLGVPFDHMALRVGPWLVDVGFGSHSHYPLLLDERGDQPDPGGTFRIAPAQGDAAGYGELDVYKDGVAQYRLEPRPRGLADFRTGCWWHRTSPESHFTRSLVCSMLTEDGRVTLSGSTLIRTVDGERTEEELAGDQAVLAAYRSVFGLVLNRVPRVRGT